MTRTKETSDIWEMEDCKIQRLLVNAEPHLPRELFILGPLTTTFCRCTVCRNILIQEGKLKAQKRIVK